MFTLDILCQLVDMHLQYMQLRRTLHGLKSFHKSQIIKLVPWGTDGRLPLSDLDLGSGHTAYRRA